MDREEDEDVEDVVVGEEDEERDEDDSILSDEMPFEDLQERVNEAIELNEEVMAENLMFENYLRRIAPELLKMDADEDLVTQKAKKSWRRRQVQTELTADQKFEIATRELESIEEEMDLNEREAERTLDNLKADMEETDIRLAEIKKDAYEFRKEIVQGAPRSRRGHIFAETVEQYFKQKLKQKDAVYERFKLKNRTLKQDIGKLEGQLQQKEDMGEVVHAIDFEKYKIENQQYQEMIAERNALLLKMKITSGNTVQVLNAFKKNVSDLNAEQAAIRKQTAEKEALLRRLQDEIDRAATERDKAGGLNRVLRKQQEDYIVPDVMSYVDLKTEMHELGKKLKDWERKVEIAEVNLKSTRAKAHTPRRGGRGRAMRGRL